MSWKWTCWLSAHKSRNVAHFQYWPMHVKQVKWISILTICQDKSARINLRPRINSSVITEKALINCCVLLTSKPPSFYIIRAESVDKCDKNRVGVFSSPLSPLPLPTHCAAAAVAASKAFDQEVWFSTVYMWTTSPHPPPLPPICTPVMSAIQMWNSQQRMNSALTKIWFSLCLCHLPVRPPPLCSCHPLFFLRNSKASTSSGYISLLPTVTWHRRPDPPSARMVSTTVSKSFFITPSFWAVWKG